MVAQLSEKNVTSTVHTNCTFWIQKIVNKTIWVGILDSKNIASVSQDVFVEHKTWNFYVCIELFLLGMRSWLDPLRYYWQIEISGPQDKLFAYRTYRIFSLVIFKSSSRLYYVCTLYISPSPDWMSSNELAKASARVEYYSFIYHIFMF